MGLDFSSSLYLGLQHGSGGIDGWASLTTGTPAAFLEAPAALAVGKAVARLQGMADGVTATSTLHLFQDWFGGLNHRRDVVFFDENIYPAGGWGVERAAGRGVRVVKFQHQNPSSLQEQLQQKKRIFERPVIVTDGYCPLCGKAAPLPAYLEIVEAHDGLLVLDDTQSLGIFGNSPSATMPYGLGGGGLLPFYGIDNRRIIVISSLAKAFGVPLATLCGAEQQLKSFKMRSETRLFTSPPSAAALAAATSALRINASWGGGLRKKLFQNVRFFKKRMAEEGFETGRSFFPVQLMGGFNESQIRPLHNALWKRGLRTVPVTSHDGRAKLCWLLNAGQQMEDIERACQLFSNVVKGTARMPRKDRANL